MAILFVFVCLVFVWTSFALKSNAIISGLSFKGKFSV